MPFHAAAQFGRRKEIFINQGEPDFQNSTVVRLDLRTKEFQTIIDKIPGSSGGVGVDRRGNVYTGIGSDPNKERAGENLLFQ